MSNRKEQVKVVSQPTFKKQDGLKMVMPKSEVVKQNTQKMVDPKHTGGSHEPPKMVNVVLKKEALKLVEIPAWQIEEQKQNAYKVQKYEADAKAAPPKQMVIEPLKQEMQSFKGPTDALGTIIDASTLTPNQRVQIQRLSAHYRALKNNGQPLPAVLKTGLEEP